MVTKGVGSSPRLTPEEQLFERIGRKATKLGMKWEKGQWPEYNAETGAHKASTHEDIIHELGHWLVSPLKLRDKPYFGLGHPGGYSFAQDVCLVSGNRAQLIEEEASILGIVLYAEFRAPIDHAVFMAQEHNWSGSDNEESSALAIRRLRRKGLWDAKRQKYWKKVLSLA